MHFRVNYWNEKLPICDSWCLKECITIATYLLTLPTTHTHYDTNCKSFVLYKAVSTWANTNALYSIHSTTAYIYSVLFLPIYPHKSLPCTTCCSPCVVNYSSQITEVGWWKAAISSGQSYKSYILENAASVTFSNVEETMVGDDLVPKLNQVMRLFWL